MVIEQGLIDAAALTGGWSTSADPCGNEMTPTSLTGSLVADTAVVSLEVVRMQVNPNKPVARLLKG